MKERLRKNQIKIYVNNKEKEMILEKFKISGFKNLRDYCCYMLIYGMIFKVNFDELERVSYEINKIGININQIAYKINSSGNIYKNDIEEIKNKLSYLNDFIKKYFETVNKLNGENNLSDLKDFFEVYFKIIKLVNKENKEMI